MRVLRCHLLDRRPDVIPEADLRGDTIGATLGTAPLLPVRGLLAGFGRMLAP